MRLIDADKLMNRIIGDPAVKCGTTFQHVILQIKDATTVDAEPVKHAVWLRTTNHSISRYCSLCSTRHIVGTPNKYCPNCGAKMDGVTDNCKEDEYE